MSISHPIVLRNRGLLFLEDLPVDDLSHVTKGMKNLRPEKKRGEKEEIAKFLYLWLKNCLHFDKKQTVQPYGISALRGERNEASEPRDLCTWSMLDADRSIALNEQEITIPRQRDEPTIFQMKSDNYCFIYLDFNPLRQVWEMQDGRQTKTRTVISRKLTLF